MRIAWAASLLLLAFTSGCIMLPIPTPEHGSVTHRPVIEENVVESLQVGTTTREDVLLRFGEPDVVLGRERVLAYSWDRIVAYVLFAAAYAAGGVAPVTREHVLLLQFDDRGVLQRAEVKQALTLEAWPAAVEWAAEQNRPTAR